MRTSFLARLTFPFLATSILAVAPACDKDEVEPTADFAKASHEQREMALATASGVTTGAAFILTAFLAQAGEEGGGCPKVTKKGDKVTIEGGCTVEGATIEGTATIEGIESDDSDEVSASWDNFTVKAQGHTLRIDGSVSLGASGLVADVDFEVDGKGGRLDGTLSCNASERCTPSDDTVIEVNGLGGAAVKGAWTMDSDAPSGAVELHGKNVMKVDFAKKDAQGCFVTTVDGAAVQSMCNTIEDDDDDGSFSSVAKRMSASFGASTTR